MPDDSKPITLARIFRFWVPMAGTWLMMSVEAPFLAAVIARLDDPKHNLAAFGVSFAVAILVESPVIMILSASTALVRGRLSFCRLRNFTQVLNVGLTLSMLVLLLTPAWRFVAARGIGLPPPVVDLTQVALLILLPWPGAIGYRRFYQGLLIRAGLTRRVAYGTVVRLVTMASTGLALFLTTGIPGTFVAATALSAGVCLEAVASRIMARQVVLEVIATAEEGDPLGYRGIASFYTPLALTSMIGLAVHPVISFFMGHARAPLESLAVLPVVNSMSFIFRSLGLSYQEVAIALLGRRGEDHPQVARFGGLLALGASAAMGAIVFTPLADVWFRGLSGLSAELTAFALPPAMILTLLPALSVLLSLQRAVLVNAHTTAPITWSTAIEVAGIVLALAALIVGLDMVGATAAAIAFIAGRVAGNLYLVPPCARVLRR
jgi:hypothetical protein